MAAGFLLAGLFDARAQLPTETERNILQQLRDIHKILAELKTQISELQKERTEKGVASDSSDDSSLSRFGGFRSKSADTATLSKIKLPDSPTEDQAREYIRKIISATRGQNSFSSEDPQVAMLEKVGPERLGLLLDMHGEGGKGGMSAYETTFYLESAICHLARDSDKELILKTLPDLKFLAKVVVEKGWEKDAKETLVNKLTTSRDSLPSEWIQAVVTLSDPSTYNDLKWYLIHNDNRYQTYELIRDLPGIDIAETVAKIWEKTGYHDWEERGVAKMAVDFGHVDALEFLVNFCIEQEEGKSRGMEWDVRDIRRLVLKHLDFRGTNKEIADWIQKNREQLVFDSKTGKYGVGSAARNAGPKDDVKAGSGNK
jgi:hypothetical protein